MTMKSNLRSAGLVAIAAGGIFAASLVVSTPTSAQKVPIAPSLGAIGDIKPSMLLEPQMQAQPEGAGWVLADGRSVAGSKYATITGMSAVPDLRGVFLRGKNYNRASRTGNADGDLGLGTFQANQNAAHTHGYQWMKPDNSVDGVDSCCFPSGEHHNVASQTVASGGNEARPNAVTVNYFIKIN